MGRNKYAEGEIKAIAKLLRLKNAGNRAQQKEIRHQLRVNYEFNISDFLQSILLSEYSSFSASFSFCQ